MIAERSPFSIVQANHELQSTETVTEAKLLRFPPEDPTVEQHMHLIESSGVLDFWDRAEEDGYNSADGSSI